ncbi:hypothetical protein WHZ78_02420 [Bradyrhizobium symbiodeficiens]|uniref:hypothetical protein n=1 Tax=Bradyrhizobium symbiodeficiens TaxID=1404367 RepID=UPI0030D2B492
MLKVIVAIISIAFGWCVGSAQAQTQAPKSPQQLLLEAVQKKKLQFSGGVTKPQDALNAAFNEVSRVKEVTVAVSVHQDALNVALKEKLSQTKSSFSEPRFRLDGQMIWANITYSGAVDFPGLGVTDARAQIRAYFAPAIQLVEVDNRSEIQIKLAVRELTVESIKITRGGKSLPLIGLPIEAGAAALANQLLGPAGKLLEVLEFHAPTGLANEVSLKEKNDKHYKLRWQPEKIRSPVKLGALVAVADRSRFLVIAQQGDDLKTSAPEANVTITQLRKATDDLLSRNKASWVNEGDLSFFVDLALVQKLVAQAFSAGPICLNATAEKYPANFTKKLKLPETSTIDCTINRDCKQTKNCEQTEDCAQRNSCRTCKLRIHGRCRVSWDEPGCLARRGAAKLSCETGKTSRRIACETEKEAKRIACEGQKVTERGVCETFRTSYDAFRRLGTDYGNVSSDNLTLSGDARICLSNAVLQPTNLKLTASLTAALNAKANGTIKFLPLNLGHLACFSEHKESFDVGASVPQQMLNVDTTAQIVNDGSTIGVAINVANPVRFLFPVEAIVSKLAEDKKFSIVCPIPSTAATIRVITPDRWWPREARGIFDRNLPAFAFDADVIKKPVEAGGLKLAGRLKKTDSGVGGIFTVSLKSISEAKKGNQ